MYPTDSDQPLDPVLTFQLPWQLVGHALRVYGEERASVRIPAAVAAAMPPPARGDSAEADCGYEKEEEEEEEDPGFMYLPLHATDPADPAAAATDSAAVGGADRADPTAADLQTQARAAEVARRFGPERHVFWPVDGF
jgi:hypothetical protein